MSFISSRWRLDIHSQTLFLSPTASKSWIYMENKTEIYLYYLYVYTCTCTLCRHWHSVITNRVHVHKLINEHEWHHLCHTRTTYNYRCFHLGNRTELNQVDVMVWNTCTCMHFWICRWFERCSSINRSWTINFHWQIIAITWQLFNLLFVHGKSLIMKQK